MPHTCISHLPFLPRQHPANSQPLIGLQAGHKTCNIHFICIAVCFGSDLLQKPYILFLAGPVGLNRLLLKGCTPNSLSVQQYQEDQQLLCSSHEGQLVAIYGPEVSVVGPPLCHRHLEPSLSVALVSYPYQWRLLCVHTPGEQ